MPSRKPLTRSVRDVFRFVLPVVLLCAGCYRTAKDPALEQRLAAIEQRLDAQDKAVAELRSRGDSTELSLLAQQISDLTAKVAELAEKVAKAPPAPRKRPEPDKAAIYSVPIGASPVFGSPRAKVTLVMAFEFACPYCRKAWDTVDELQKTYGKDLRVAYKQFIIHPTKATAPAIASCAAKAQGKWRALADLLWVKAFEVQNFDPANIDAIASEAGLDMQRYRSDITGTCVQEIKDDNEIVAKGLTELAP
jgi:protein-disulfide isomerase